MLLANFQQACAERNLAGLLPGVTAQCEAKPSKAHAERSEAWVPHPQLEQSSSELRTSGSQYSEQSSESHSSKARVAPGVTAPERSSGRWHRAKRRCLSHLPGVTAGQAGVEALVAVIILMLMFAAFLGLIVLDRDSSGMVAANLARAYECEKIARVVEGVYAAGSGAKTAVSTDFNVLVGNGFVNVAELGTPAESGTFCKTYADMNRMYLVMGLFEVENSQGIVVLNGI